MHYLLWIPTRCYLPTLPCPKHHTNQPKSLTYCGEGKYTHPASAIPGWGRECFFLATELATSIVSKIQLYSGLNSEGTRAAVQMQSMGSEQVGQE